MRLKSTLEICQDKAREKCIVQSEGSLVSLSNIFDDVLNVTSNTLNRIWNNYELMTTSDWGGAGDLILTGSGQPGIDNREKFESILSVFSLGLIPVKNMIYEGAYVQSSTLLRSNIEILVQLRKILDEKYEDNKTPRISHLDLNMRKIYSELTGLAHLSDSVFLANITKGNNVSGEALLTPLQRTLTPYFNIGFSEGMFSLHIVTSIEIIFLIDEYLNSNILDNSVSEDTIERLRNYTLDIWATHLADKA